MKLLHPLGQYKARVASGFGERWGTFHAAIDFAAPVGTPVYASWPGKVIKTVAKNAAGKPDNYGEWYDKRLPNGTVQRIHVSFHDVEIEHPNGLFTRYSHLSGCDVKVGQIVNAGDLIGNVGSAGTGAHLHYEVKKCKGYYGGNAQKFGVDPLNPQLFTRNLSEVEL